MTNTDIINYELGAGAAAFSTMRNAQPPCPVVCGRQVHGTSIALVDRPDMTGDDLDGYDALMTSLPGCAIGVRTADCIPVLLYDPVNRAVAAVHSGWRGTLNRISQKTIFRMRDVFGTEPENIHAVIGPGICRSCFQVGEEVVQFFKGNGFNIDPIYSWDGPKVEGTMRGGHHIDLVGANRILLRESGVLDDNISWCGICTYDDARFYSARREGAQCGRFVNAIMIV